MAQLERELAQTQENVQQPSYEQAFADAFETILPRATHFTEALFDAKVNTAEMQQARLGIAKLVGLHLLAGHLAGRVRESTLLPQSVLPVANGIQGSAEMQAGRRVDELFNTQSLYEDAASSVGAILPNTHTAEQTHAVLEGGLSAAVAHIAGILSQNGNDNLMQRIEGFLTGIRTGQKGREKALDRLSENLARAFTRDAKEESYAGDEVAKPLWQQAENAADAIRSSFMVRRGKPESMTGMQFFSFLSSGKDDACLRDYYVVRPQDVHGTKAVAMLATDALDILKETIGQAYDAHIALRDMAEEGETTKPFDWQWNDWEHLTPEAQAAISLLELYRNDSTESKVRLLASVPMVQKVLSMLHPDAQDHFAKNWERAVMIREAVTHQALDIADLTASKASKNRWQNGARKRAATTPDLYIDDPDLSLSRAQKFLRAGTAAAIAITATDITQVGKFFSHFVDLNSPPTDAPPVTHAQQTILNHNMELVGQLPVDGFRAYAVDIDPGRNLAYLNVHKDYTSTLEVVNVSNPAQMVKMGEVVITTFPEFSRGIAYTNTVAYSAVGNAGFCTVDVSQAGNPNLVGCIDTPGTAYDVLPWGHWLYVADEWHGLQQYDITTPTMPLFNRTIATESAVTALHADGNILYVGQNIGFDAFNAANPTTPLYSWGDTTAAQVTGIRHIGNFVYLSSNGAGLISIRENPIGQTGRFNSLGGGEAVDADTSYAYLASNYAVHTINTSDPDNLTEAGFYRTTPFDLKLSNGIIYVADQSGLLAIRYTGDDPPTATPTPTPTWTWTPIPTSSWTPTPTETNTPTPTDTHTPTPTHTSTPSKTPTPTDTPTPTYTWTPTPTSSWTPTPTWTWTPSSTSTPSETPPTIQPTTPPPQQEGDLQGNVFHDKDLDGAYDVGVEPGLPGAQISLLWNGIPVSTTVSGLDGSFGFAHIFPRPDYRLVEITPPTGYHFLSTVIGVTVLDGQQTLYNIPQREITTHLPIVIKGEAGPHTGATDVSISGIVACNSPSGTIFSARIHNADIPGNESKDGVFRMEQQGVALNPFSAETPFGPIPPGGEITVTMPVTYTFSTGTLFEGSADVPFEIHPQDNSGTASVKPICPPSGK